MICTKRHRGDACHEAKRFSGCGALAQILISPLAHYLLCSSNNGKKAVKLCQNASEIGKIANNSPKIAEILLRLAPSPVIPPKGFPFVISTEPSPCHFVSEASREIFFLLHYGAAAASLPFLRDRFSSPMARKAKSKVPFEMGSQAVFAAPFPCHFARAQRGEKSDSRGAAIIFGREVFEFRRI